jgi:hypothetical protein
MQISNTVTELGTKYVCKQIFQVRSNLSKFNLQNATAVFGYYNQRPKKELAATLFGLNSHFEGDNGIMYLILEM